jgi:hypothetical protein
MKKIIITGAPRTGSTALNALLMQSSKILVMNELAIFDYEPNHYYNVHREKINNELNQRFLKHKNLSEKDIDDFFIGNFENKGNLEFFGDKFLTYCYNEEYCDHLVKNHSDAYFIFTYRNPCATIHSRIKRSKIEKDEKADWYFTNLEETSKRFITRTSNWVTLLHPYIKNKFIIDYDHYINNANLLIKDLSSFLNTDINIQAPETLIGHNEIFDNGKRGLYENSDPHEYKNNFSSDEIAFITERTKHIDQRVKSLIKNQSLV